MGVLDFPEHDTQQMCWFPPLKYTLGSTHLTMFSLYHWSDCGQQKAEMNPDKCVTSISLSITFIRLGQKNSSQLLSFKIEIIISYKYTCFLYSDSVSH